MHLLLTVLSQHVLLSRKKRKSTAYVLEQRLQMKAEAKGGVCTQVSKGSSLSTEKLLLGNESTYGFEQ
jgi:hypothetical protein